MIRYTNKKVLFFASCFLSLNIPALALGAQEALSCKLHFEKAKSWHNYHITLDIVDAVNLEKLATIQLGSSELSADSTFVCEPNQLISFITDFSPPIWIDQANRRYPAKTIWSVPTSLNADNTQWKISLCFPEDFADIPLPPTGDRITCN